MLSLCLPDEDLETRPLAFEFQWSNATPGMSIKTMGVELYSTPLLFTIYLERSI
jgi:hypothetical protein